MGHCELLQLDGEEEVEAKSQGGVGGGMTTGATRQPAGKQEANRRGGIQEARGRGGISGQEAAERREDERRRRHDVRRCDNQPETEAKPPPPPPPSRLRVSKKKRSDVELQRAVLWCTVS